MDTIELNEAFVALGLAVLRQPGVADDVPRVNANGGAIALGRPLGASSAGETHPRPIARDCNATPSVVAARAASDNIRLREPSPNPACQPAASAA